MARRARTDAQKEQRRQAILDAAWELFRERPFNAINITDIADAAGLAKGTVYLYFNTKEELFLTILEQQFEAWFDEMDGGLHTAASIDDLAELAAHSLAQRPATVRLIALAHVVLEQNINYDTALRFKRTLLARILRTGTRLETCLPFLAQGEGARLCLWVYALVIGVENLANPAPIVREVMTGEPDMRAFEIDFTHEFADIVRAVLYGLKARREKYE